MKQVCRKLYVLVFRPPTYAHHVVMEIVSTEEAYVGDLIDIVEVCIYT